MKWLFDSDGKVSKRAGLPVIRPPKVATPCMSCAKIPAGEDPVRKNAIELSERNWQAYQHYLECRAVGQFPKDPIVRRNARVLRAVMDECEQRPLWKLIALAGLRNGSNP